MHVHRTTRTVEISWAGPPSQRIPWRLMALPQSSLHFAQSVSISSFVRCNSVAAIWLRLLSWGDAAFRASPLRICESQEMVTMTGGKGNGTNNDDAALETEVCVGSFCFAQPHPLYVPPPYYGKLLGQVRALPSSSSSSTFFLIPEDSSVRDECLGSSGCAVECSI